MDNEQAILDFCTVTGASTDVAQDYLQIADGNVETAVTLYIESGGQSVSQSSARPTTSTAGSSPRSTGENLIETDEEIARRLQQEERGREQVRAPIAPRRDILTGGGSPFEHSSLWGSPANSSRTRHPFRSVFNQGDSYTGSPGPDFLRNLEAGSSSSTIAGNFEDTSQITAKAKRLADLFRPPFDIMFKGGFEEARASAKEQTKWMLVNIQDQTEFSCQVVNRDLWSDKIVKEIIRESFVFLQYDCQSPEGKRYATLYPIKKYPHISIIDSRTGERVKTWEKMMSPTDFVMDITEFLEQRSPDGPQVANVSDMSEDEQIKAAIAASLGNSGSEEAEVVRESSQKPTAEAEEEEEAEASEASKLDTIQPIKRDEPTDMANSTRIQLRMADGKRVIRRFMKTDPVQYLFEFVKAEFPEAQTRPFELVFNRKQLIEVLDQQIAEAGLENAAVNLVFL